MKKNLLLLTVSLCLSLISLEFGLRWFTVFPIHIALANRIYDDRLAYRMDPSLKDIDSNGFRNNKLLKKAEIVTLGDSFTFGNNVEPEYSWPRQLADMSKMSVYNFGVGGYCGLQYHSLMDQAIALKPRYIVLGLFLPNDLKEICTFIVEMDYWKQWAKKHGYSTEICLDAYDSISYEEKRVFNQTAIGSLITYFYVPLLDKLTFIKKNIIGSNTVIVSERMNKTIIDFDQISLQEDNMDLNQQNISLAFEITKDIISSAKKRADSAGAHFIVLFIPSRIRVFYDYLLEKGFKLPSDYHRAVDNERILVDEFSSFFEESEILFVDAESFLVRVLYKSGNVYPYKDDHPLETGYKAYAKAVYEKIQSVEE